MLRASDFATGSLIVNDVHSFGFVVAPASAAASRIPAAALSSSSAAGGPARRTELHLNPIDTVTASQACAQAAAEMFAILTDQSFDWNEDRQTVDAMKASYRFRLLCAKELLAAAAARLDSVHELGDIALAFRRRAALTCADLDSAMEARPSDAFNRRERVEAIVRMATAWLISESFQYAPPRELLSSDRGQSRRLPSNLEEVLSYLPEKVRRLARETFTNPKRTHAQFGADLSASAETVRDHIAILKEYGWTSAQGSKGCFPPTIDEFRVIITGSRTSSA